jgi:hypothetical protein
MLRFIVMSCGYVENATTSVLIYQCEFFGNPGYTSYKEAITDLALDMYGKFHDDYLSTYENRYSKDVKRCCCATLIANKEAKFCSECGSQIVDKEFHYDQFMEYVSSLHSSTCDSYGEAEWTNGGELHWWPWGTDRFIGAPKEDVIYIAENAEVILLSALLDAKPELRNEKYELAFSDRNWDWDHFKNEKPPSYR